VELLQRLALDAGLGTTATQDALAELDAAGLVYRASRGNGPVPGSLALRVPDRDGPRRVGTCAGLDYSLGEASRSAR
jgi:hypothetical protein